MYKAWSYEIVNCQSSKLWWKTARYERLIIIFFIVAKLLLVLMWIPKFEFTEFDTEQFYGKKSFH